MLQYVYISIFNNVLVKRGRICAKAYVLLCYVTDTSAFFPLTTWCSHFPFIHPLSIHLLLTFIFFSVNQWPFNQLRLEVTSERERGKKSHPPLVYQTTETNMCFWFEKAVVKQESWDKYSSRTLKRPHLAIISKWNALCGLQRVELRLWLQKTDATELYSPALISAIFKAKQNMSSEWGLVLFVAVFRDFLVLMTGGKEGWRWGTKPQTDTQN